MARPKLGDGETERLHVKITSDELEAIDEWRFANRIASRSEAVRRLCQIGILVENELDQIVEVTSDGVETLSDHSAELAEVFRLLINRETYGTTFDRDQVMDLFLLARDQADRAEEGLRGLHTLVVTLYNAIAPLAEARSLRAGKAKSEEIIDKANEVVEQAVVNRKERERRIEDNRYLALVFNSESPADRDAYDALPDDAKDAFLEHEIERLRAEETADPTAFAERHGIDTDERKFWEKPDWQEYLDRRYEERKQEESEP